MPSIHIARKEGVEFSYDGIRLPWDVKPEDFMREFINNPEVILERIQMPKYEPEFTFEQMEQRRVSKSGDHRNVAYLLAMNGQYVSEIIKLGDEVLKLKDDAGESVAKQIIRQFPATYGRELSPAHPEFLQRT